MLKRLGGRTLWMQELEHPYVYLRRDPTQIFMKIGRFVIDPDAGEQVPQKYTKRRFGFHPALTLARRLELDRPYRRWLLDAVKRNMVTLVKHGALPFATSRKAWDKYRHDLEKLAGECVE